MILPENVNDNSIEMNDSHRTPFFSTIQKYQKHT